MGAHVMKWHHIMQGKEGFMHYLIDSLLSDDPEDLGRTLELEKESVNKLSPELQNDLSELSEFRKSNAKTDDYSIAERYFVEGYDDLWTMDVLERLQMHPQGREFLRSFNISNITRSMEAPHPN